MRTHATSQRYSMHAERPKAQGFPLAALLMAAMGLYLATAAPQTVVSHEDCLLTAEPYLPEALNSQSEW